MEQKGTLELNLMKPVEGTVSRDYKHPYHNGIDYAASRGTKVVASEDGEVIWARYHHPNKETKEEIKRGKKRKSYGHLVIINHTPYVGMTDDEKKNLRHVYTLYAHLYGPDVSRGQYVKKGEPIGHVGNTGDTYSSKKPEDIDPQRGTEGDGSHLHFEVLFSTSKLKWVTGEDKLGLGISTKDYSRNPIRHFDKPIIIEHELTETQLKTVSACVEGRPVIDYERGTGHMDWYVAGIKKGTTDQYNKEIDLKLTGEEVERILKDPTRYVAKRSADLTYDVKV